jgi:hypothetical protein
VRRKVFGDAGLVRVALDDVPESVARHAIGAPCGKHGFGLAIAEDLSAGSCGGTS